MEAILNAHQLCLTIEGNNILDKVSFQLFPRQITTLIGPNGAGKTSLIRIILGLQKASSGQVSKAPQLTIGYMPQKLHIDLSLPLSVQGFLKLAIIKQKGINIDQLIGSVLEDVAIAHLLNNPLAQLSGGETQRVLLARAMLRKPQLLVLDEPVQGVDVNGQEALYQLITQIRDRTGCSILMISHDLHLVMADTDQVLCLNQHLCCHGSPEKVSSDPIFTELFGSRTALYTHHHDHQHDLHGKVNSETCHHG